MKKIIFILLIISFSATIFAQNHYWVFFTDKKGVKYNPYEYLDRKAIQRRIKDNINLFDTTDFPVKKQYIEIVQDIASVNVVSRWFNCVSVIADDEQIKQIAELDFVKKISKIYLSAYPAEYDTNFSNTDKKLLSAEMNSMQAQKFSKAGISGKGVRIAIFDAGFPNVDKNPVFEHLRKNHQILKTYDFAKKKEYVYDYNSHGSMTLSCIAGQINGKKLGMATDAEFLLARTEVNSEPFSEEENWLAAAEWADKNGADIISSSLGYTVPRYFQYEMDGKTTLVAKAAKMASDKGILVVNSMGNDGSGFWKVVGTPADVDEVLSVGAIDPQTLLHSTFSSFGPTADGTLKPEVVAPGHAVVAGKDKITNAFGTSFSCPLVSGFAACVMQLDTNLTGQKLKQKIIQSANLYPYFDYANGYGIPQASFFTDTMPDNQQSFSIDTITDTTIVIKLQNIDCQRIDKDYFYYHFRHPNGKISEYFVIEADTGKLSIDIKDKKRPFIFMAHYRNYTKQIEVK